MSEPPATDSPPPSAGAPPPSASTPPPPRRRGRMAVRLIVLAFVFGGLLLDGWTQLHAPLAIAQPQSIDVALGSRLRNVLSDLRARALLKSDRQAYYLWIWARLRGEASQIKAGEYALQPGLTPVDLLAQMLAGKTVLHEARFVEGWRFGQALATLRANPDVVQTLREADDHAVMTALGKPDLDPEGRFFPDTYRFPKGTTDLALLRQAATALDRHLASEWQTRAPNLPYDRPEQALVMASLIEKETGVAEERPRIAGVFVRRLRQGMRLQTDPTVIYGMGAAYDGNIRSRDLLTDTPYNTYTRDGLPPTPICLPGRDALHAALHPEDGTSLYFVARGDGTHQFSSTLDEHNAAVRRYQLAPRTVRP